MKSSLTSITAAAITIFLRSRQPMNANISIQDWQSGIYALVSIFDRNLRQQIRCPDSAEVVK